MKTAFIFTNAKLVSKRHQDELPNKLKKGSKFLGAMTRDDFNAYFAFDLENLSDTLLEIDRIEDNPSVVDTSDEKDSRIATIQPELKSEPDDKASAPVLDDLLSRKQVMIYCNISVSTLNRREKLGSIPKAVRIRRKGLLVEIGYS